MKRIYRYEVPVDDEAHLISLKGEILKVDCRDPWTVEFWALHDDSVGAHERTFTVVGTGYPITFDYFKYIGSAVCLDNNHLVWHLLELP